MTDTHRPFNVLILCTGNSARSILAEALFNILGQEHKIIAWSAGSKPSGQPHPTALATLEARGHQTGLYRSKSWDEFAGDDAPNMDLVVTVCSSAANEVCPIWPCKTHGLPITVHWPADDPAYIEDDAERAQAFSDVYDLMTRRVTDFLALPRESWHDRDAVQALS